MMLHCSRKNQSRSPEQVCGVLDITAISEEDGTKEESTLALYGLVITDLDIAECEKDRYKVRGEVRVFDFN
jgi:hypothetical protein